MGFHEAVQNSLEPGYSSVVQKCGACPEVRRTWAGSCEPQWKNPSNGDKLCLENPRSYGIWKENSKSWQDFHLTGRPPTPAVPHRPEAQPALPCNPG